MYNTSLNVILLNILDVYIIIIIYTYIKYVNVFQI